MGFSGEYVPFFRMGQPNLPVHIENEVERLNADFNTERKFRIGQSFEFFEIPIGNKLFLRNAKNGQFDLYVTENTTT